jgi:hypothetical protein
MKTQYRVHRLHRPRVERGVQGQPGQRPVFGRSSHLHPHATSVSRQAICNSREISCVALKMAALRDDVRMWEWAN